LAFRLNDAVLGRLNHGYEAKISRSRQEAAQKVVIGARGNS